MVVHSFPEIGAENPGAVDCVRRMIGRGWDVVLFTARCGEQLEAAIEWCEERFPLLAVNVNPWWNPGAEERAKPHFDLVVDDTGAATPLLPNGAVDWGVLWPIIERRICR